MNVLKETLQQVLGLIKIETNNLEELKDEKLEKFKEMFNIEWDNGPIYHNKTCIVITERNEIEAIAGYISNDDVIFRMELQDYNIYFYVIRIIHNPIIRDILEVNEHLLPTD